VKREFERGRGRGEGDRRRDACLVWEKVKESEGKRGDFEVV
jgi:hypothetical protein